MPNNGDLLHLTGKVQTAGDGIVTTLSLEKKSEIIALNLAWNTRGTPIPNSVLHRWADEAVAKLKAKYPLDPAKG
jgi:hypothetical protein